MEFKLVKEIVAEIIKTIQNTAIAAVQAIRKTITSHTYSVKVKNPIKEVKVSGKVQVLNQISLKQTNSLLEKLKTAVASFKVPDKIEVKNFPKYPEFPKFPKKIEVSNLLDKTTVTNLNIVVNALGEVKKSISKLKLSPKIKVDAPKIPTPVVNVPESPAPIVNVEKPDLSALNDLVKFWQSLTVGAKKSLSVRLTDGKRFYKAVDKLAEIAGSRSVSPFVTMDGDETRALVDRKNRLVVAADINTLIDGFSPTDDLIITDETVGPIQTIIITNGENTKTVTINNETGTTTIVWT